LGPKLKEALEHASDASTKTGINDNLYNTHYASLSKHHNAFDLLDDWTLHYTLRFHLVFENGHFTPIVVNVVKKYYSASITGIPLPQRKKKCYHVVRYCIHK
jgi:hypothetical protein